MTQPLFRFCYLFQVFHWLICPGQPGRHHSGVYQYDQLPTGSGAQQDQPDRKPVGGDHSPDVVVSRRWHSADFGISIDSFRIAGGILVVTIAMSMISGKLGEDKQNKQEKSETAVRESIGVVPLALP